MNPEENHQQPEPTYQQPAFQQLEQPVPTSPPAPVPNVHNPLESMRPGEQVICEIKRHPIGIYGTYVIAGFMFVAALVAAIAVPMIFKSSTSSLNAIVWGICGILMLVAFVMLYVGTKVYWGNRWIVTSDSITETTQTSLFDIQSSQLSMGNVEDVTVEQDGVLCHMFGYGMLRVETAGQHSKFVFPYCPDPKGYARKILDTREQFEQGRRGDDVQRLYRAEGAYANQPYGPQYAQLQPPQSGSVAGYTTPPMPPAQSQQPPVENSMPPMPPNYPPPSDNGGIPGQQ